MDDVLHVANTAVPAWAVVALLALTVVLVLLLFRQRVAIRREKEFANKCSRFEALVRKISTRLLHDRYDDIDIPVGKALEDVADFVGARRASMFRRHEEQFDVTGRWCADGERELGISHVGISDVAELVNNLGQGKAVLIDVENDATSAAVARWLKKQGLRTILALPLQVEGSLFGFLTFDDPQEIAHWAEEEVHFLSVVAQIIASALRQVRFVQALRVSEEKFSKAFRCSPTSIVISRVHDAMIIDVNDSFLEMFGYQLHEVIGRTGFELDAWVNVEDREQQVRELEKNGFFRNQLLLMRSKSGRIMDIEASAETLEIDGVPHILTTARDVTKQRIAQQSLRDSEARYRALVEHAAEAIVVFDIDRGRFVSVNQRALELFKCDRNTLLKHGPIDLSPPLQPDGRPSSEAATQHIENTMAGNTPSFEWTHRDMEGNDHECEIRLARYPPESRRLVRGSILDISERKAAERKRAQLESELKQLQKMEAIGRLTGGIAHDFNNILASVIGYTELARENADTRRSTVVSEYLAEVHRAAMRARDLVAQLLTFSRSEGGEPKDTEVNKLVDGVLRLLRPMMPSTIDVVTFAADDALFARVDPVQLEQAIVNLCINARDAMAGRGQLQIRLGKKALMDGICTSCQQPFGGEFIEISVADSGHGISDELTNQLFEPFFSSKPVGEGSGMGLSMVHGVVHNHGGHIVVDSVAGSGATFRLFLPVATETVEDQFVEDVIGVGAHRELLHGNVLVVDDEHSVGALMGQVLESRGLTAHVLSDSREALEYFRSHADSIDLVVTDQTMPAMTGTELAREMLDLRPDLPVVLCSGFTADVSEESARQLGIRGFHHKPIDVELFFSQVAALLDEPRTHADAQ